MAELVFFSGTMDSGKSTLALQMHHNHAARGRDGVLFTRHDRAGAATAYAMTSLQERGVLFVEPATEVYEGMIVGENSRADDMDVNITKEKQQTNIRSATSDNFEKLIPPKRLSLEQCLEFCREDECVEVTPEQVRIRKLVLDANARAKTASRARKASK